MLISTTNHNRAGLAVAALPALDSLGHWPRQKPTPAYSQGHWPARHLAAAGPGPAAGLAAGRTQARPAKAVHRHQPAHKPRPGGPVQPRAHKGPTPPARQRRTQRRGQGSSRSCTAAIEVEANSGRCEGTRTTTLSSLVEISCQ